MNQSRHRREKVQTPLQQGFSGLPARGVGPRTPSQGRELRGGESRRGCEGREGQPASADQQPRGRGHPAAWKKGVSLHEAQERVLDFIQPPGGPAG